MVKKQELKRELGLFQVTMAGVGYILGAGIYVLIGLAAGYAGNATWISFLLGSFAAIFTGLSYAELSSMMPRNASEFLYGKRSLGELFGFFGAFMMMFSAILASTSVALGFAKYFSSMFGTDSIVLIAAGIIILLTYINWKSIKGSSNLNILCTFAELGGLLIIIALALLYGSSVDLFEMPNGFGGVFKGAALVFFAYLGFEGLVKLAEETKEPHKTIPQALVLSIIITSLVYIAVAISAVSVLDWHELAASKAPLADVASKVMGSNAFILLSIIALFSTANTVLMGLVTSSRGLYGLATEFKKIGVFARVGNTGTPTNAVVITAIVAILFLLIGSISIVAELTNFTIFMTFIIVNLSVIFLRLKEPRAKRPFKVPLSIGRVPILPVLGILTVIFLTLNLEPYVIIGGIIFSLLVVPLYYFIRNHGGRTKNRKTI
ncbi:MAG: APC family permease [Candidatus Micrarchaeia archaeon]